MNTDELLTHHGDALYAFARQRLESDDDIADCIQETLLAALRNASTFEGRSSQRTWLIGILKFKIFDTFRARAREALHESIDATDGTEAFTGNGHWEKQRAPRPWEKSPLEQLEQSELKQHLYICIEHLPPIMRTAVRLRELDGFQTHEICNALQVTATNLNVILYRARLHLRSCLENAGFTSANG